MIRPLLRFTSAALCALFVIGQAALVHSQESSPAVRAVMEKFVEDKTIAGAVTLIADSERILALDAVGLSDIEDGTEMHPDHLFWIASMTKPVAGVAILILQDEGKLSVDDPVAKHLPEFREMWLSEEKTDSRWTLVPSPRPITIKDLLTHTSGLDNVSSPRPDASLAELVAAYSQRPLKFPPGSKWEYCNSGINTLGRIVEVVSGQEFATFIQERIFNPLQMTGTTFWPSPAQAARVAKSYNQRDGKLVPVDNYFLRGELTDRSRTPYPAGGLYSTAKDMARFYQMMLNEGQWRGRRVVSKQAVAQLTKTQTSDLQTGFTTGMSWGLGFQVVKEPQGVTSMLSPGTFGHGGAYATQSWADPATDRIYVLMIQRAGFPNGDNSPVRQAFQEAAVE